MSGVKAAAGAAAAGPSGLAESSRAGAMGVQHVEGESRL